MKECDNDNKHDDHLYCTIIARDNHKDKNMNHDMCGDNSQSQKEVIYLPKISHSPYFDNLFGNDIGSWSDVMQSSFKKKQAKQEEKRCLLGKI